MYGAAYCGNGSSSPGIELTHRAHTRDHFAHGASVTAARLKGKPNGFYSIFDVKGLDDL